jgi:hypothetical protein
MIRTGRGRTDAKGDRGLPTHPTHRDAFPAVHPTDTPIFADTRTPARPCADTLRLAKAQADAARRRRLWRTHAHTNNRWRTRARFANHTL